MYREGRMGESPRSVSTRNYMQRKLESIKYKMRFRFARNLKEIKRNKMGLFGSVISKRRKGRVHC